MSIITIIYDLYRMEFSEGNVLNINIGIMGHVDSGKTSLSKALSETASTASFDKNPQSQQRGITLDLGFSCFTSKIPDHLSHITQKFLQCTLVDCPGHASLFKTVIGGSKIIDLILLVVDITKSIELQTAECIILAGILGKPVITAISKVDFISPEKLKNQINTEKSKILKVLQTEKIESLGIFPVTSNPSALTNPIYSEFSPNVLKENILNLCQLPPRSHSGSFLFAVDHCFGVKGQGTIMTGTVVRGNLSLNETILIPGQNLVRQVKSIQIFRRSVSKIEQGDRAALAVSKFDPKNLERGLICSSPSQIVLANAAIIKPNMVKYFKKEIKSGSKYNISIGFEVVTSSLIFFNVENEFNLNDDHIFLNSIDYKTDILDKCHCLIKFEHPVMCVQDSLMIGVKLGTENKKMSCRIAFHGRCIQAFATSENDIGLQLLKVYNWHHKTGYADRFADDYVIVKDMFHTKSCIDKYIGKVVEFSTGDKGVILGRFGQSGRIRVGSFNQDSLSDKFKSLFANKKALGSDQISLIFKYKKYRKIV